MENSFQAGEQSSMTSYKMQEEIMSKENGKYVHKSKETLNI